MNPLYTESVVAQSDPLVDAFVRENVVHGYDNIMTVESLWLMPICLEKSSERKNDILMF